MKTPEQLAEEYLDKNYELNPHFPADVQGDKLPDRQAARPAFLAGYKAAKEQLADADKVITYDYVETASDEARELIAKFELKGNEEVLVKALVAAYCRGVDAVDGYLRNSLGAYRASVKQQQWISVKDRLPEDGIEVLFYSPEKEMNCCFVGYKATKNEYVDPEGNGLIARQIEKYYTHWQPLPAPPKEEK